MATSTKSAAQNVLGIWALTFPNESERPEDQIEKLLRFLIPNIGECLDHLDWDEVKMSFLRNK